MNDVFDILSIIIVGIVYGFGIITVCKAICGRIPYRILTRWSGICDVALFVIVVALSITGLLTVIHINDADDAANSGVVDDVNYPVIDVKDITEDFGIQYDGQRVILKHVYVTYIDYVTGIASTTDGIMLVEDDLKPECCELTKVRENDVITVEGTVTREDSISNDYYIDDVRVISIDNID